MKNNNNLNNRKTEDSLDQKDNTSKIQHYKDLIIRSINGEENVDYGIDPTNVAEAIREIELLRKAYDEVVKDKRETGGIWWKTIVANIPIVGAVMYAVNTVKENEVIRESKAYKNVSVIAEKIMQNCFAQFGQMKTDIEFLKTQNAELHATLNHLTNVVVQGFGAMAGQVKENQQDGWQQVIR